MNLSLAYLPKDCFSISVIISEIFWTFCPSASFLSCFFLAISLLFLTAMKKILSIVEFRFIFKCFIRSKICLIIDRSPYVRIVFRISSKRGNVFWKVLLSSSILSKAPWSWLTLNFFSSVLMINLNHIHHIMIQITYILSFSFSHSIVFKKCFVLWLNWTFLKILSFSMYSFDKSGAKFSIAKFWLFGMHWVTNHGNRVYKNNPQLLMLSSVDMYLSIKVFWMSLAWKYFCWSPSRVLI